MAISVAAVITSLMFGLSHCRWMRWPTWFSPSGTPIVLHVAFGICMAVLRWRFASIGPGVAVHALWNALYPLTT
jgi:membrane protease YdiL (CAAX protease family)